MKIVARRPAGHRALLDAVDEPPPLSLGEQRDEILLEVGEVLLHRELLVAPDEAADGVRAEPLCGVEDAEHEVVLLPADGRVVVEHVVEVGDVGEPDPVLFERGPHAACARLVERLAQVERVCDGVEHGLGRNVRLRRVERGRELDVIDADLAGEGRPVFDGAVRVGVAHLARRQLLERRRQHADLHELGFEWFG
jgi:hypothetical protein